MRPSRRLLAIISDKASTSLNPYTPTGLTGVYTHPCPRPHLIYLYSSTLEKLKHLPESSVYRQSTESLTKHRLSIISAAVPAGYDEWKVRSREHIDSNPSIFGPKGRAHRATVAGKEYVIYKKAADVDERALEWDGEEMREGAEGPSDAKERKGQADYLGEGRPLEELLAVDVELEDEPSLTAQQVGDVESQIGAGLIEEVIAVAEGELKLVDTMMEAKVWEELEEKPLPGQWEYFPRDRMTGQTQAP